MASNALDKWSRDLAESFIDMMQNSEGGYDSPWKRQPLPPINMITGRGYRGGNFVKLMTVGSEEGFDSGLWATYKTIKNAGGQVKRGSKGTKVLFWRFIKKERKVKLSDGSYKFVKDERGFARPYTVFALEQCSEYPDSEYINRNRANAEEDLEGIPGPGDPMMDRIKELGIEVRYGGDSAYYDLKLDIVNLPYFKWFKTPNAWRNTLMHEVGHWTGHASRLNRHTLIDGTLAGFFSTMYAREELRAEIAASITCAFYNVRTTKDHERSAHYLKSWVKALRDDPREIFRAASDAQKMADYITGKEVAYGMPR